MSDLTAPACLPESQFAAAVAIIPARYASTRFPGKPLVNHTGKYLIQHVYEQAARAKSVGQVIVATDDQRIFDAVRSFGGQVAMTRTDHPSGTDRVAEVAAQVDCSLIVNVQGDEPELEPDFIDRLVRRLRDDMESPMATLACPFSVVPGAAPTDPNAVKVAVGRTGRALYFSRSLIPYPAAAVEGACETVLPPFLHLGIYAYRREFLLRLAELKPTPLEQIERLEQLRVLEHGYPLAVVLVDKATVGVDTPEDYAAFVRRCSSRAGIARGGSQTPRLCSGS